MNSFEGVICALFLALVIALIAARKIYLKTKKHILKNSNALKEIEALSQRYEFYPIKETYTHKKIQKSVAAFNRMNYENELISFLREHQNFFANKIQEANENAKKYEQYCVEFERIKNNQGTQWSATWKNNIEKAMVEESKASPVCKVSITIGNKYVSPMGRNEYYNSRTFSQSKILKAFDKIKEQEKFEEIKQDERAKMSESLRYDILKRDGFKCVICGATAQDGAKLHVDHIVPISKGGKTINSNLRTLCSSCNLGKSDKYDPNGLN